MASALVAPTLTAFSVAEPFRAKRVFAASSCAQEYLAHGESADGADRADGADSADSAALGADPSFCTSALRSALFGSAARCETARPAKRARVRVQIVESDAASAPRACKRGHDEADAEADLVRAEADATAPERAKRKRAAVAAVAPATGATGTTASANECVDTAAAACGGSGGASASNTDDASTETLFCASVEAHSTCACGEPLYTGSQVRALLEQHYVWAAGDECSYIS